MSDCKVAIGNSEMSDPGSSSIFERIRYYFIDRKRDVLLFTGYVVSVIISLSFAWWLVLQYSARVIGKSQFVFLVPLVAICAFLFILLLSKWKQSPQKVFLLLSIPMLFFFAFFLPPNQVPDEIWHIQRVFDFLLPSGGTNVPAIFNYPNDDFPVDYASLYTAIVSTSGWEESVFIADGFDNYPLVLYIFPGITAYLAQFFDLNPFITVCVARCANATVYVIAAYWMIKIIPIGKVLTTIYLLNPMMLQQDASCSADAMVNVYCLFFIVYLIKLVFEETPSKAQLCILIALTLLMMISKYAYAPLLLLWMLLVRKIKNKQTRIIIYSSVCIVFCGSILAVILFYDGSRFQSSFELIRNVPEFCSVMLNTGYELSALWIKETFGMILGPLNLVIWEPCFWAYMLILLFSAVFNLGELRALQRFDKIYICVVVVFMTVFLILIFREWTLQADHRSDVIMGIQGRYFLPYFLLPLLCLITVRSSLARQNIMILYSSVLVVVFFISAITIVRSFL